MTNFQKVINFNRQFGVLDSDQLKLKNNIIKDDPKTVEFCLKLIREEVKELEDSVVNNDFVETVDALGDILYVVYGMGARLGVNMDLAFELIHDNNMSKLCKTEQEAINSVNKYKENLELYDSPNYRRAPDGIHWVVFNESTKKILKSIDYQPVDLKKVCL
jgi:NTP pyrophosphatase (non-canonical NTP hydrolase)